MKIEVGIFHPEECVLDFFFESQILSLISVFFMFSQKASFERILLNWWIENVLEALHKIFLGEKLECQGRGETIGIVSSPLVFTRAF